MGELDLVRCPFFVKFDPKATWYDQLEPLSEADREFFIHSTKPDPAQREPTQLSIGFRAKSN